MGPLASSTTNNSWNQEKFSILALKKFKKKKKPFILGSSNITNLSVEDPLCYKVHHNSRKYDINYKSDNTFHF
jgi:hypothetical protein